jgi:large repetitive protein
LVAANGLVYVSGATGTATGNTIFGSGDQQLPGPPGGGTDATAVLLFGATNVTITHNTITGAKTDVGVSVSGDSTGTVISFNQIGRTAPDAPDPTGHGIDVFTPDGSMATPICNTFTMWNINIVGAEQIGCTSLPPGAECQAYSAPTPTVDSGMNWNEAGDTIIDTSPFTWVVDSGTLPPGLTLSSGGVITGTPTAAGTFDFTVKLVDSTGLTTTQAQTIIIAPGSCGSTSPITQPTSTPPTLSPTAAPAATTASNSPTTGATSGTLPVTGMNDALPLAALVFIVLGLVLVVWSRRICRS